MPVKTLTINGQLVSAPETQTLLDAARTHNIAIPTMCHLDGVGDIGACRLCLVEVTGSNRLLPACLTHVAEGMEVQTHTPPREEYRKMIIEMLLSERNHICAVCVANGHCELQDRAAELGVDHVKLEYLNPQ